MPVCVPPRPMRAHACRLPPTLSLGLRVAVLTSCRPPRLTQPRACSSTAAGEEEVALPPLALDKPLQRGAVHFVSTPIGNLEDITLRAIRTLREADVIATEDAKVTAPLLRRLHIHGQWLLRCQLSHARAASEDSSQSGGWRNHILQ